MRDSRVNLKDLFFVFVAIVYFIECNPTIKENTPVRYMFILIAATIAVVSASIKIFHSYVIKVNLFHVWIIVGLIFFYFSSSWSLDSDRAIQSVKNLFIVNVICLSIILMVENESDFYLMIRRIVQAFVAETIYVVSVVGLDNLGIARLGADYEALESWNANGIATFTAWGCVFASFLFIRSGKRSSKIQWGVVSVFLGIITLYTGSRKGIIIIATLLIYGVFSNRGNKRIRNICLALLFTISVYLIIMNNEELYILIGARLERMFMELTGHETTEHSMSLRSNMITYGLVWFTERPLLGYGLGNYSVLYAQATGWDTYSHCNYIEILMSGGLIGFAIYYSIYFSLLIRYIKCILSKHNQIISYFFCVLIALLLLNASAVLYADIVYITVLLLVYLTLKLEFCYK